jgi:predicted RNA-binding Zn-ribbon protein involved in translation (DUF1610 family)
MNLGGKAVAVIAILGVGIPGVLYELSLALDALGIHWPMMRFLVWGALGVGGLLFFGFVVLLMIEQIQDHLLYQMYLRSRGKRIRTAENLYECPYCGNRKIREFEHQCPVCGKSLFPFR